ncbi:endonuclease/exonuclease/phosphatase family protein [uncultured Pseudonocardia sp.]|uniref:endonuclease/exonuclease/phosphatase family protein n=1 Tax=uncultured Pseudonocardia sp. TaxID=211455 RepID=UPI0026368919|nr:endonuclease/exonuclease/phosphatase family protein [Pseudonocardia sp. 73-21]
MAPGRRRHRDAGRGRHRRGRQRHGRRHPRRRAARRPPGRAGGVGVHARARARLPYRETGLGGPDVAVFSRFPIRRLEGPGPALPGLRVQVDAPAGPFVVYGLHVPRPWLTDEGGYQATVAEHHAIMTALAARIAAEPGPVVVAGDLNSSDRGRDYRLLVGPTQLVDAARAGAVSYTSTGKWLPLLLRIDHLLVGPGWCGEGARQIGLPGSDHRGVTATVGPCVGSAS